MSEWVANKSSWMTLGLYHYSSVHGIMYIRIHYLDMIRPMCIIPKHRRHIYLEHRIKT